MRIVTFLKQSCYIHGEDADSTVDRYELLLLFLAYFSHFFSFGFFEKSNHIHKHRLVGFFWF